MPRNLSLLLPPLLFDFGDCESDRRREAPFLGLLDRVEWNGSFALESFFGESRALFVFFVVSLFFVEQDRPAVRASYYCYGGKMKGRNF